MDQDSTKDGTGGDRRNWRERLGVGQDLPKISDEFKPAHSEAKEAGGESQTGAAAGPRPGAAVARPAPMAPRYARTAPRPGNGSSPGTETQGDKSPESPRFNVATPELKAGPETSQHLPSNQSSASGAQQPGHVPLAGPASQHPAPSRGPGAYPRAAARPAAPAAGGNDSFGERLRAQREAAEKLAQQRLAAAREKSGHAGTDALAILAPHNAQAAPQGRPQAAHQPAAQPKPSAAEQPRFTFAQEEIAAAQQETAFSPSAPAAGGQQHQPPPAPQAPPQAEAGSEPDLYAEPESHAAAAPEYRAEHHADYRHEDDGMFEAEQPEFDVAPPRASAADYSAAYREFEDEFEEEPRRRSGPMLLLASLTAVAVVSGGLIYWYQQSDGAPAVPDAGDLPVVSAPEEPAKADPQPQEQPQQAAQPTTRKQIYDRIIGEETLEPERIVPTEEEPQLRQIQRPGQQPRASGAGQEPGTAQEDSTEPLPLPLPPPPGTGVGEQGDLLVPGMANTQTASALAEPAQPSSPEPAQLSLPEPEAASASQGEPADPPASQTAEVQPASGDPPRTGLAQLRDTTTTESGPPVRASIYPEVNEPLAYPNANRKSPPPQDRASEPAEDPVAPLPEREVVTEPEPEMAEPEPEMAEPEPDASPEVEQASDVPLPRAKPEPPVMTATEQAQPQRQATAPESGSGPVQIIPADVGTSEPQAPSAGATQQPQAQATTPRRRTFGRESDSMVRPRGSLLGGSSTSSNASAPQQQASVAPETTRQAEPESTGGYIVQLASFRSEAEARNEYQRLVQRHPELVGDLDSRIQEASLGQIGAFYRLGVGPVGNRTEATRLCNALIAAGEKDCLVRRN